LSIVEGFRARLAKEVNVHIAQVHIPSLRFTARAFFQVFT
jgi:hypothetical protein